MFVPKATGSLLNPRRRQRTGSEDSVKLPKAKRQRSILCQDNLQDNLRSRDAVSEAQPTSSEFRTVAEPDEFNSITVDGPSIEKQLVIRGPKKTEQRDVSHDGTVILVSDSIH